MITIHEKTAQNFHTLGLGALLPSSCVVTEEVNGAYELKMKHPYDEKRKWKRVERSRILYAPTPRGMQPFRIYHVKPNMSGIEVNARHIFYDLLDNQCSEISFNGTASGALAALQGAFAFTMPFSFTTDISVSGTLATGRMNPVQALLSDDDETTSFVKGFGGELLRDGFNISMLTAMGQDRDVTIRYGKNLVGLDVTEDEADVKTRIQYHGSDGSGTLDSPFINEYVYPKIYTLEDENKTKAELKAEAQALFDGGADLPLVNIKVDFITLADTVEYADYAPLEEVFLGDIVTIINQKMNFAKQARVISYEWDCLLERYNEVELGDFMPTLAASVTSGVRSGSLASAASVTSSAVAAALKAHMQDKNNPHEVTAEQTGGSSGGSSDADTVLELLVEHEENKENPHGVTAAQVGAYTREEVDEKLRDVSGGGASMLYGSNEPIDTEGVNGDIYLQMSSAAEVIPLEYIQCESDGAYFDTGVVATGKTRIIFRGCATTQPKHLFCARQSSGAGMLAIMRDSNGYRFSYGSKQIYASSSYVLGNSYTFEINRGKMYIDGTLVNDAGEQTFNTGCNILLFAFNTAGTVSAVGKGSIMEFCQVYEDDILVGEYVPARDENNVVCILNRVSKEYIYLSGNGTVTAPEKGYTRLEYIESDGSQYVDTEVQINGETYDKIRMVADVVFDVGGSSAWPIVGQSDDSTSNTMFYFGTDRNGVIFYASNRDGDKSTGVTYDGKRYIWDLDIQAGTFKVDDLVNISGLTPSAPTANRNLYLFAYNMNNSAKCHCSRAYLAQYYIGGTMASDLIPVVDAEGAACLYNTLNNKYHRNKGTGSFISGPEVSQASSVGSLWLKQNGTWTQVLKGAA